MFIARLFGFMVVILFVGALGMSVLSNLSGEGIVVTDVESGGGEEVLLSSDDMEKEEVIKYVQEVELEGIPDSFRLEKKEEVVVKKRNVKTIYELKGLIFRDGITYVMLDNNKLENPLIKNVSIVLVGLIGFDETHFVSTGKEAGLERMIYGVGDVAGAINWDGVFTVED